MRLLVSLALLCAAPAHNSSRADAALDPAHAAWVAREKVLDELERNREAVAEQKRMQTRAQVKQTLHQRIKAGEATLPSLAATGKPASSKSLVIIARENASYGFAAVLPLLVGMAAFTRHQRRTRTACQRQFVLAHARDENQKRIPVWVLASHAAEESIGIGRVVPEWLRPRSKISRPSITTGDTNSGVPARAAVSHTHSEPDVPFEIVCELFAQLPEQLRGLREEFDLLDTTVDVEEMEECLCDLLLHVQSFIGRAAWANLGPAVQLGTALSGVLMKLLDKPASVTPRRLETMKRTFDALERLCDMGLPQDLLTEPPLRFLLVAADASSRTMFSSALQTHYTRPDAAGGPTAALGLAGQHAYDVIIMDTVLPEVSIAELAGEIKKTELNRHTPLLLLANAASPDIDLPPGFPHRVLDQPALVSELHLAVLTLVMGKRLVDQTSQAEVDTAAAEPEALAA